jgi:hypothetical protein
MAGQMEPELMRQVLVEEYLHEAVCRRRDSAWTRSAVIVFRDSAG